MSFRIGDKVRFKDETGEGVITGFPSPGIATVMLKRENIEIPYPVKKLVKVVFKPEDLKNSIAPAGAKDIPRGKKHSNGKRQRNEHEIDLHIEHLVTSRMGLSNGEILNIQLGHFRYCMEKAIVNRTEKLIFIHGVGDGVLKQQIRRLLADYPGVRFEDAPFRRYGFGATEVYIR